MKLTVAIQLKPTELQAKRLLCTLERANLAANSISKIAWATGTFQQFKLHKLVYFETKKAFELAAQMVVRLVYKVTDAYKVDRKRQRVFTPHGSIAYDDRILRFFTTKEQVSIWTLKGRETIPFVCGPKQRDLLKFRKGESDLVFREGKWYLFVTVDIIEPVPEEIDDFIGVDLGIVKLATLSTGQSFAGKTIHNVRARNIKLRAKLQAKGTKSAKRLLKKRSFKEARFAKQVNHHISKRIVQIAKAQGQGIALEDLKGICGRIKRFRRRQRYTLHSWSFYQLLSFIQYKARKEGVRVEIVPAAYTSQTCAECGYCDKANRPNQSSFLCKRCSYASNAEFNAARVISYLGGVSVNSPYAVSAQPARLVG